MARVLLVSSEPLGARLAGIGLRYVEFARRLAAAGMDVRLTSPADVDAMRAAVDGVAVECVAYDATRLDRLAEGCDAVVAQGQLANDVVLGLPQLPTAIDLYDPWLLENLHYAATLGLDPYRNDHASWTLQLSRGDFFLCSSSEQRHYYLGLLTAYGRVHPEVVAADPSLDRLIARVPFGVPESLPPHRAVLPERRAGEKRVLFGGIYDWYDPETVLEAMALPAGAEWRLFVVRHPNQVGTPQVRFANLERIARQRGWWDDRVVAIDWVERDRRFDLLRDVDALVALHRPNVETDLSFRTRFLDGLVAGCPVVATSGGALSQELRAAGAGWLVEPGDAAGAAAAIAAATTESDERRQRVDAGHRLALRFAWSRVLEPLIEFCRAPWRDQTKERFAVTWPTRAPADTLEFRVRRRLRRWAGGA
jgi:hypothetical protein